jgi:type IV pilus assembly protein PilE
MPGLKPTARRDTQHSACGFTIIELLVVIAIVALLTAIAVPSYQDYVLKSRRTEAKELLFTAAQRLQQYFTQNDMYTNSFSNLNMSASSRNGHYTLTIAAGTTGSINTSYTLTAAPNGSQANDSACGNFVLNSLGTRTVSGSQTQPSCW